MNKLIKRWTSNPLLLRADTFLIVWFGPILGSVVGIAVFTSLTFAEKTAPAEYVPVFNSFFLLWPLAAIAGSILFFQGFWFELGKFARKVFLGKWHTWHRPGAVFYGGFLGSTILVLLLANSYHVSVLYIMDFLFLFIPFFHGLSRLACLNFGCCYGKPCSPSNPLAVCYTHPLSEPVRHGFPEGQSRHATQLYEMMLCILLGMIIFNLRSFTGTGKVFSTYLAGYGLIRFLLEFVRDNSHERVISGLSIWQFLSLVFLAAGISGWIFLPSNPTFEQKQITIPTENYFNTALIATENALLIALTFGIHFRKRGESL